MSKHSPMSIISLAFMSMATVLMIGMKLVGLVSWSWWVVLFPLWVGPAYITVAGIIVTPFVLLAAVTREGKP
jgi:hypothetical protein